MHADFSFRLRITLHESYPLCTVFPQYRREQARAERASVQGKLNLPKKRMLEFSDSVVLCPTQYFP